MHLALRLVLLLTLLAALPAVGAEPSAPTPSPAQPTVIFMTDFGQRDDSVAICKGAMLGLEPRLRIIDLSHDVEPYSVLDGARFLAGTAPYYPAGTVFVTVIDPGVGSERRALVAKTKRGQFFVLPDNGLTTLLEHQEGITEVRNITNAAWHFSPNLSSTFHGRDVFAPVGARLARGDDWTQVGPPITDWQRLNIPQVKLTDTALNGTVLAIEHPFGNLVTNADGALLAKLGYQRGDTARVTFGKGRELRVPLVTTFSAVPVGKPLMYVDSRGRVAFAVNQGHFAQQNSVKPLTTFVLRRK
ncbi:SAM hydrolase/SAM-dependent halogenase family protein [Hyalangium sp.]|uniref:SAM hydrolase/SAM-dependent halogenase family protein n=1 Tax=Hyalangium sp. TaxID=2028555 RepID=UPI002D22A8D2|nr:SAM-dependent chlorinase/fluorinase [Hyalangium sp.]HYH99431.1 SAM-dependent chlorinase/fluorinase [Hyalangium sp.]